MTARNAPWASKDAALIRINQTVPRLRQLAYPEVVNAAEFKCLFERLGDPPGKRSMTFIERVTAVPARPAVMDGIAITSVCWRFRSTTCRSAPGRPAARSSEKHAGTLSPKRSLSVSISGDFLHSRGQCKRLNGIETLAAPV